MRAAHGQPAILDNHDEPGAVSLVDEQSAYGGAAAARSIVLSVILNMPAGTNDYR